MTKIGDLEKRVAKLEKEISTLMKKQDEPQATAMDLARPSGKTPKRSKSDKKTYTRKNKEKKKSQ